MTVTGVVSIGGDALFFCDSNRGKSLKIGEGTRVQSLYIGE